MKDSYLVAIDQGTSSCRALLVDTTGTIIDIVQKEFTQIFPQSGWVKHDANEIWKTQFGVFKQLLELNRVDADQILGIV